jgi:flagellar hook-basal body protein
MGVNISVWQLIGSMKSVDKWSVAAQTNLTNSTRTGYKQTEVTFGGGATSIMNNPAMLRAGNQVAEQMINLAYTSIDWSQGEVISTRNDFDFAVNGQGFFMVTDNAGNIYYTRDGEFRESTRGTWVNNEGLTYVDKALAINMGLYTAPAPTVAQINANNTGWVNKGANNWFPYVSGTTYDEGGTSYQNMTINAKKTVFVDLATLPAGPQTVTVHTDNAGYPIVNGTALTALDVISGTHPSDFAANTTYNITPYLRGGANTFTWQVTEGGGGEDFRIISSTIPKLDNTNWATEVTPFTSGATPTGIQDILKTDKNDIILGLPILGNLNYSRFGSTIFEASPSPNLPIIDVPELQGLGQVKQGFLEASNVNPEKQLLSLNSSKNAYTVLAKQLSVYWQNFDIGLNLLK